MDTVCWRFCLNDELMGPCEHIWYVHVTLALLEAPGTDLIRRCFPDLLSRGLAFRRVLLQHFLDRIVTNLPAHFRWRGNGNIIRQGSSESIALFRNFHDCFWNDDD